MNTSHDRQEGSEEWYTPPEIVKALGPFDLDPCAPIIPVRTFGTPSRYAAKILTKEDNGLESEWQGRVWMNPPLRPRDGRLDEEARGAR